MHKSMQKPFAKRAHAISFAALFFSVGDEISCLGCPGNPQYWSWDGPERQGETNLVLLLRETLSLGDDQIPMCFCSVVVLRESQRLECVILQSVICINSLCWINTLEWFSPFFYCKFTSGMTAGAGVVIGVTEEFG